MFHRRATILAAAVLAAACTQSVEQNGPPDVLVFASFSPPAIPLPNDLALQSAPTLPAGLQKELLQSFVVKGGFPSDQEVAITVPFHTSTRNVDDGTYSRSATPPSLDLKTVNESTVAVLKITAGAAERIPVEVGGYANGVLALRKVADAAGSRRWAPGRYVAALRGGEHGVKTTDGRAVAAERPIALVAQGVDLMSHENQPPGITPAQVQQLSSLQALYAGSVGWKPVETQTPSGLTVLWQASTVPGQLSAFAAVDTVFPHQEIASVQTFGTQPSTASPLTDSGSGQIPFPSDFLLDPASGKVRNNPAFGPAAAGLATLDGFSTTGMMLVPLTAPVKAATVNANSVLVFELPAGGTPRRLRDVAAALGAGAPGTAEYLTQPPALNRDVQGTSVTTALGLQPGIPVPTPTPAGIVYVPPLKQKTRYAVIVTDRVKDTQDAALVRSTLAEIVFGFQNPLVVDGKSQIPGVSDADAGGLQALRTGLAPLLDNLGALSGDASLTRDHVVLAYTVTTQTVTDVSVKLSAAPYDPNGDGNMADNAAFTTVAAAPLDLASFGITAAQQAALFPSVAAFLDARFVSLDAIDPANGALNPDPSAWTPVQLSATVAVPKCGAPPCVAPLVVWHHGLNGGRLQMLGVAESLAAKGFVVIATDAPYHGDRAFCSQNSDCTTDGTADGVCTPDAARAGQGDAVAPGTCTTGHLRLGNDFTTEASGNYFISGNFFRIRDGIRQDLFDHAALILAAARPPPGSGFPQPQVNALAAALAGHGVGIDPTRVYLEGLSLGGINGTEIAATNPRISRAVLSSPGGTLTDIFTNAPAFKSAVDQLFLSLGIDRSKIATDPAVAARYVQTLILAKWILDPADPINYAQHVETKLPSPLAALGPLASSTTAAFGQLSKCDPVVPNRTTVVGGVPLAYGDLLLDLGTIDTTLYDSRSAAGGCVDHGVILDTFAPLFGGTSIGGPVREDAARFLSDGTLPPAAVTLD
ncbi:MULTISPECIES: hypothetical protein [unclassified Anaeromyxobacter]|uniref:alpha/beta hydrolase family protein n=1 Tax=unclassified Anaeromyxobacter TaxID=2620896 RepID=UPI001F55C1A9|nr:MULTISPECIES: hypothetical protein [unclassified Anaeromyxobacter]